MIEPYRPSWRKPVGMLLIVAFIAFWAFLVASFSGALGTLPGWAQLPIYAIAGMGWIAPLRPLLQWMETGRWRRPETARRDLADRH